MQLVMPKLGLTMTQATLTRWLRSEGETVRQGEIVFEFESEKATMEYEAPESGQLARVLVPAGETVLCGTPVAVLETTAPHDPADPTATSPLRRPSVARDAQDRLVAGRPPVAVQGDMSEVVASVSPLATPAARRRARELGVDLRQVNRRGPEERVQLADVEAAAGKTLKVSETFRVSDMDATPIARTLAADLGVDLGQVQGSGPGGRIRREDVLAVVRSGLTTVPTPPFAGVDRPIYASAERLQGVRAVIARRMTASAFTAPHVTLHTEAGATALVEARRQINEELAGGLKVSYNALLVALAARALREHPALNACLVEDEIRVYGAVNVALAVDTERGLLVPVIRDADRLDLVTIQRTGDELIQRALAGRSLPDDLAGGTFTLTNLGMYEIDGFTPIINQPQAAILGVGRIVSKPVDVGGEIKLRQMMTLSLSFDHRIVDGAGAARFLQRVKQLIERPFALAIP